MLSPIKLIIIALIIGVVWYAYQRFGLPGVGERGRVGRKKGSSPAERRAEAVEDVIKCRYCDTYFPAGQGESCGRPECPGSKASGPA